MDGPFLHSSIQLNPKGLPSLSKKNLRPGNVNPALANSEISEWTSTDLNMHGGRKHPKAIE